MKRDIKTLRSEYKAAGFKIGQKVKVTASATLNDMTFGDLYRNRVGTVINYEGGSYDVRFPGQSGSFEFYETELESA